MQTVFSINRVLYNDKECEGYVSVWHSLEEAQTPLSDPLHSPHCAALKEAIKQGSSHTPLLEKDLVSWYEQLLKQGDSREISKPNTKEFSSLCEVIHKNALEGQNGTLIKKISAMAEVLYACQSGTIFSPILRRMESLVLSYLISYYRLPLIVIKNEERERFFTAHASPSALSVFLADKVRERCLSPQGELFTRVSLPRLDNATENYRSPQGEEISIEWHELFQAQATWRQGLL